MAYLGGQAMEGAAIAMARASAPREAEAYRHAMREFSSGIAIVAAGQGEKRNGCTATSLCSLSLDPPSLIVCLARTSGTLATIQTEGVFGVSLLAGDQADLADCFAGRGGLRGVARFAGAQWTSLATGAPLCADAIALIDCEVEETIERHTHAIVIGRVVAARAHGGHALVHWRGRSRLLR
jgi:flavin reductase (DIM6/NTAB) family NADH-FMN oxidoreductase RutF